MHTRDQILKDIKQAVLSVDPQAEIVLFGSRARGDYKEDSDWDVLVLTDKAQDNAVHKLKILDAIYDVELRSGYLITPIIRNKKLWQTLKVSPLFNEVRKDGVEL